MAWGNLCGGWSGRSRRRGCQAVVLHTNCCLAKKWRWQFEGGRRQAVRVKLISGESDRQTMADLKSLEQAVEAL